MNKVKGNILLKSLSLIPDDQYGLFFNIQGVPKVRSSNFMRYNF